MNQVRSDPGFVSRAVWVQSEGCHLFRASYVIVNKRDSVEQSEAAALRKQVWGEVQGLLCHCPFPCVRTSLLNIRKGWT